MFEKYRRWLKGSFVCRKCGGEFRVPCFGYGTCVCPNCFNDEQPFLYFDDSYWLNRIVTRLMHLPMMKEEN